MRALAAGHKSAARPGVLVLRVPAAVRCVASRASSHPAAAPNRPGRLRRPEPPRFRKRSAAVAIAAPSFSRDRRATTPRATDLRPQTSVGCRGSLLDGAKTHQISRKKRRSSESRRATRISGLGRRAGATNRTTIGHRQAENRGWDRRFRACDEALGSRSAGGWRFRLLKMHHNSNNQPPVCHWAGELTGSQAAESPS